MTTRSSGKTGILYLDVEGGWGGSSRSLYYMVEALDRTRFQPVVLLRKPGPVEERYAALGVPCFVTPELTSFRPAERKNAVSFAFFLWGLRRYRRLRRQIDNLIAEYGIRLLHVNHESLASIGHLIARRTALPWVGHVRTELIPGWFARRVYRLMMRSATHVVFIVEPCRKHFARLVGPRFDASKTTVVLNIMPVPDVPPDPLPEFGEPSDRFRVLSLTNFSPNRGVDRIVDVAAELRNRGEREFAFYLCGQPAHRSALTGRVAPYYEQIVQRVRELELEGMVLFPGHVSAPERALAACDCMIKLTRQANPWGRDIMEALAAGLPVITLGSFQEFVENGVNGFVDEDFSAGKIADHLCDLAGDAPRRELMRKANQAKARRLFDGKARAREIEQIYEQILDPNHTQDLPPAPAA